MIKIILNYNSINKMFPILLNKNIFGFLLNKVNEEEQIKNLCKNCLSIPILFQALSEFKSEYSHFLIYNDLPSIPLNVEDFPKLIDIYEKIDCLFKKREMFPLLLLQKHFFPK